LDGACFPSRLGVPVWFCRVDDGSPPGTAAACLIVDVSDVPADFVVLGCFVVSADFVVSGILGILGISARGGPRLVIVNATRFQNAHPPNRRTAV
jgi:hypothetical protein